MRKSRLIVMAAAVAAAVLPLATPDARAAVHLVHIVEVFPGTPENPLAQFVELRMDADGQNVTNGTRIDVADSAGQNVTNFATFTSNAPVGLAGRRILACRAEAAALFGLACDVTATGTLPFDTGIVAFSGSNDAVTYGLYTGSYQAASQRPAGYLERGRSLVRINDTQDTNDGYADFRYAGPSPTNNAGASAQLPPGDRDSDGVSDQTDVCPSAADAGQADADADGLGDVCDRGPSPSEIPPPPPPPPVEPAMRVQEIFVGSAANPTAQYVELRFSLPATTADAKIYVADRNGANGALFATFTADALFKSADRRLLACTLDAVTQLGLACDAVTSGPLLDRQGGAVFFSVGSDLVFYGAYTASLQGQTAAAALPPDNHSIDRTRYTGQSGADFAAADPTPTNNAGLSTFGLKP